jgi:hypothetical protein
MRESVLPHPNDFSWEKHIDHVSQRELEADGILILIVRPSRQVIEESLLSCQQQSVSRAFSQKSHFRSVVVIGKKGTVDFNEIYLFV